VAGIVAAIAVIYLLIKNWKKVKQFFAGLWKWFSKMLDNPIFVALGVIMMPWITVPALIIKHWKKIVVFFSALWRWFLKLLDNPIIAGLGLILAPFITVPALIVKHWKLIKTFFSALWSWFYKSLNNPILATVGLIFAPLITVPTLIVKHWKTLKTFFLGLWPWFYKMLNNPIFATVSAIFAPLITIPTLIAKNWKPITKLFDTICRGIGKVGGAIMKFLGIKFTKEELATLNGKDSKPKKQGKPPKKVPHYARGTDFVPENQMAYLHKGERILPANFRQNSGGVTNIYQIQSNPKLTVPSDTPKKQAEYLRKVAKETIKTEWQSILRQTVGGNPIPQGS
jgi:hypothetical protein